MKKNFPLSLALVFATALMVMSPSASHAQGTTGCRSDADCTGAKPHCCNETCQAAACVNPNPDPNPDPTPGKDPYGFGKNLDNVAGNFKTSSTMTLEERISSIIAIFLSFLGVIFLILMIYAGFNWMTAAGDEEKITKSKQTIRSAIIGLIIVVGAYGLSIFVIDRIWGAAA